jgi:NADH-quinone oxidoreductase subunit G
LGAVKVEKGEKLSSDWAKITIRPEHTVWAKKLVAAKNPVIVLGEQVETLMQSSSLRACAFELAKTLGTELGEFTAGPNTAGAWFTGCVSHRGPLGGSVDPGDNALDLFTGSRKKAYFLYQVEPEYDSVVPAHALQALRDAELVIVASSFVTDEMKDYADFILPVATFAEMPGTFINIEGKAQSFKAATMPHGHVRPGWKVLRVLSNFCHLDGFEQRTIDEVRQEIHAHSIVKASFTLKWDTAELKQGVSHLTRLSVHPAALADSIARRSSALQETVLPNDRKAAANSKTASALGLTDGCQVRLKQGSSVIELALRIDDKLASQMIFVPAGIAETKGFGRLESEIEVERIGG